MESELEAEQEFVDIAYARLDAMRSDANSMLEGVLDLGRGGTFQSRTERDVIVRTSLARLEQLDIGDQALTFGRIDRGASRRRRRRRHRRSGRQRRAARHADDRAGRSRPSTSAGWPSTAPTTSRWWSTGGRPIAEPFYRATGRDPQGLVLRRHLALEGRRVVGVEDERFGASRIEERTTSRATSGDRGGPRAS